MNTRWEGVGWWGWGWGCVEGGGELNRRSHLSPSLRYCFVTRSVGDEQRRLIGGSSRRVVCVVIRASDVRLAYVYTYTVHVQSHVCCGEVHLHECEYDYI